MNALWHINNQTSILKEEKNSGVIIKNTDIKIYSLFSMISTGTERLIAKGKVSPEMETHMSVPFMNGSFDLPIKYGYSLVGKTKDGTYYHTMHPHQDEVTIGIKNLTKIPYDLSPQKATLVSNMETIINAIWDSNPSRKDRIAICGFGNIGSLLATTLRVHLDIEVTIIEIDEWRKEKAIELSWKVADTNQSFDMIYHTTASESGLQYCIDHLEEEGKVIELSWYGDKSVNINLGNDFHYKRLHIISSQVSVIPKNRRKTETYKTRKNMAFIWLCHPSYDALITNIIPFKDSPVFFDKLRKATQPKGLIYLIEY